jgi:MATE family multidrug resistance protein
MLNRDRIKMIMALALPIIGGMVSQNVLNLVDTAMVGTLGDAALAAVNLGGFANWLSMAFITGLATGVQAMSARRLGEGRTDIVAVPLNGGLLQAIALGIPTSIIIYTFVPVLFPFLIDDPAVVELGVPYLRIRLLALTFIAMNFAFRGFFNGVNLSKLYMSTLIVMHVTNIVLNYLLIFGNFGFPEMGVSGAAAASAIAAVAGTLTYFVLGLRYAREGGFLRGLPDMETMMTMLRLAVPSGIQGFFFAAGMTSFSVIVGMVGTAELAATGVMINLMLVAILPAMGFGLAATSLVGQALGRKNEQDAARWGWDVSKVASVTVACLTVPAAIFPDFFLGAFLYDADTLALARFPFRVMACGMWFDAIGMVLLNAHFGAGDAKTVMRVSIVTQWVFFLPAAYLIGPVWGGGLTAVWIGQMVYRMVQAAIFMWSWKRGRWAKEV